MITQSELHGTEGAFCGWERSIYEEGFPGFDGAI